MKTKNVVLFYPSYAWMGTYHWLPFPYIYIGPFLEKAGFKPVIIDARVEPEMAGSPAVVPERLTMPWRNVYDRVGY